MTEFITMPTLNANDESAVLVAWLAGEGESVGNGQAIAEIETTKTTGEVYAPRDGHLRILAAAGEEAQVGTVIGAVTPSPTDVVKWPSDASEVSPSEPVGAWTKKAEVIADRAGIDIAVIANRLGRRVGVADVEALLEEDAHAGGDLADDAYPNGAPHRLGIMGGGDGAMQVIDITMRRSDITAVAIYDDDPALRGRTMSRVPIIGGIDVAADDFRARRIDTAVVTIGTSVEARRRVFDELVALGIPLVSVIDPSVVIGTNSSIGAGNLIMPMSRIGPAAQIGDNNFISAHANIEHHAVVGNHCTFGPGVHFSGRVTVGDSVRFGTGIHVEPWLTIGDEAVIASGVTLTSSVPARTAAKSPSAPVQRSL